LEGRAKEVVRKRLIDTGVQMRKKLTKLEARLDDAYEKVEAFYRDGEDAKAEALEDQWLEKLKELERICTMLTAIEEEVLG
jgi:2-oxoglutarate dehydrogenase complex dehydrogenase (E1) component-like enzyme